MNITTIYKLFEPSSTCNILHRIVCKVEILLPVKNWRLAQGKFLIGANDFWHPHHASSDWGIESQESRIKNELMMREKPGRWGSGEWGGNISSIFQTIPRIQTLHEVKQEGRGEVSHPVLLSDILLTTKSGKNHTFTHVTLCLTVVNSYDEIGIRNIWVVLV